MAKEKKELSKFQKFLLSKKYKTFMGYLYGWGAAVVMVGAYFKLTHIQGADFMLALGLGIEAVIFFMSAFEPQPMNYQWDNVFVELEEDWDGQDRTKFGTTGAGSVTANVDGAMIDKMFDKMNVSPDTLNKISRGLDRLAAFQGTFVSMGNPHFVIFLNEDVEQFPLSHYGPLLEHHSLFPQRCNIEFVQVIDDDTFRMRVWERGSGITLACGTGACATAVAAHLTGRASRQSNIQMDGGTLHIEWNATDNHILMTGPAAISFEGEIELDE